MVRVFIAASLATLMVGSAQILAGGEKSRPKEAVDKAQRVVSEHLEKIKGGHGQILHLADASLAGRFPDDVFFAVRYRQFPVARQVPEGLRASNVFVVRKEYKLLHVKDARALEQFFKDNAKPVKDADSAGTALAAWLILTQEAHQDGFFKFEVNKKNFAIEKAGDDITAIGRALVMEGGNGEINAALRFEGGKLAKAMESSKIIPGPRPICQATKLLDADPIVRRMAENDLLYLGDLVKDYLEEQRAQATPELQRAIDQIWQRITKQRR